MDKFGRPLQFNNGTNSSTQVVIPPDFVRLDGTSAMQANLDLGSNEIHNVSSLRPPTSQDIKVDGSFDLQNNSLHNIQSLRGTNSTIEMSGNIDLGNQYEVVNTKFNQSPNALVPRHIVDNNYHNLESIFDKGTSNIIPVTGQVVTASSFHANWSLPANAFDNNLTTQWIIAKTDTMPWIQIQFPNSVQLYKVILHPRLRIQKNTHIITNSTFLGSNDGTTWTKIFESSEHVNKIVTIEFPVTRPYTYYRLETQGNLQFGLSNFELYSASVKTHTPNAAATEYVSLPNFVLFPF